MNSKITLKRVENAVKRAMFGTDNPGFCKACGHEQEGCEPDMEGGTCERCGKPQVTGAANLLVEIV
jgi:hypothetical protein